MGFTLPKGDTTWSILLLFNKPDGKECSEKVRCRVEERQSVDKANIIVFGWVTGSRGGGRVNRKTYNEVFQTRALYLRFVELVKVVGTWYLGPSQINKENWKQRKKGTQEKADFGYC